MFSVTALPTASARPPRDFPRRSTVGPLPTSGGARAAARISPLDATAIPSTSALTGTAAALPHLAVGNKRNTASRWDARDFGTVAVGSNASGLTIRNTGAADLTGLVLRWPGADAASALAASVPGEAAGHDSFTLRFDAEWRGVRTAALYLASNDASANPFTIALTGAASSCSRRLSTPVGTLLCRARARILAAG